MVLLLCTSGDLINTLCHCIVRKHGLRDCSNTKMLIFVKCTPQLSDWKNVSFDNEASLVASPGISVGCLSKDVQQTMNKHH